MQKAGKSSPRESCRKRLQTRLWSRQTTASEDKQESLYLRASWLEIYIGGFIFAINKCQHFMTIKERELQKLYEMFLPKPFVKDSRFIAFCSFESETLLPDLKRLQLCLQWEVMLIQGTWKRTWLFTHLSQHEVHLSWAHQPGLKCYGPASLLTGLEIVVSLKTILWYYNPYLL